MRPAGLLCTGVLVTLAACLGPLGPKVSDDDTPPTTGRLDVEQWLAEGLYKKGGWTCEPLPPHPNRYPSPHGFNRICSNKVIVQAAAEAAAAAAADPNYQRPPWPKGAAAVKEIYTSATAKVPVGHAVYVKTDEDSAKGAGWYWYQHTSVKLAAFPQDANGVAADSKGGSGLASAICVSCHVLAGSDTAHTPAPPGGSYDLVYTPLTQAAAAP